MNYNDFVTEVEKTLYSLSLSGTSFIQNSGSSFYLWIQRCLEDEIEQNQATVYPAVFLCPIPMVVTNNTINYSIRMYLVNRVELNPSRMATYSHLIESVKAFIQYLPDNIIPEFNLTINPVLLFDNTVDGIYTDLTIKTYLNCQ